MLIFALLGVAKVLALGPMPELAAHAGFTTSAYRLIGALEPAGAIGVAIGPALPLLGELAGLGLLLLLAGAVTTHVRRGTGRRSSSPQGCARRWSPGISCSLPVPARDGGWAP